MRRYNFWSVQELQYVRDHAGKMPAARIGEHLGRSKHAVRNAARKMGVSLRNDMALVTERNNILMTAPVVHFRSATHDIIIIDEWYMR
jgi:hypothetical protein